ncbi:ABC transporter solute-binding protein, family 1 [Bifidobacterium longum subsp. longum]|nr:ABC transporter solute-binding protein, family 1 [Bifidobacterium longum subsp. longum]
MSIVIKVRVSVPVLTGDGRVDDERERFDDESYSEVSGRSGGHRCNVPRNPCRLWKLHFRRRLQGQVYYLNFKPEAADQWAALAKEYTKEKGVDVKVQTAASGTYEQTLKSEIAKTEAPTLFQVNGPVGYQNWKKYTADMSNTDVYKELTNQDVALKDGDKVVGVPYVMETYGLIYNKDILNKYFALDGAKATSMDEIDNFDTLKAVADDMQSRKDELGIKGAFTSAGFDSSSDWRFKTHLANLPLYYEFKDDNVTEQPATIKGTYLPNYKKIFDLYITDPTTDPTQLSAKTGDDANSEFALGEAAFYQNGTWAWTDLQKAGMKAESVGMMPIYTGVKGEEKQGLATGSENYWCINDKASDADKKATEDFLSWVITSDTGKKAISQDMGFTTPFKTFDDVKFDNPLTEAAVEDQKSGKTQVSWNFTMMPSEEWKNKVGQALLEYAQGTGKWDAVKTAFVDGWASEYEASH